MSVYFADIPLTMSEVFITSGIFQSVKNFIFYYYYYYYYYKNRGYRL